MPAMHFASAFSLSAFHPPPSLPLIHQWQNLGDVCFITCLIAFLSLLAKQGFWKGQSCHPTCRGVPTYLQPQKKLFPAQVQNVTINSLQLLKSNAHLSLPVVILQRCEIRSGTNWNNVYAWVWLSVLHSIKGWSVMDCLPASRLFVNFANVAVHGVFVCMSVLLCLYVCVCVSLQNSRWYLVSGVSAVDI